MESRRAPLRALEALAALSAYLAGALVLTRPAWTAAHPGGRLLGELGDPAQGAWFLAWTGHALSSGSNPFFSGAMFAPGGIDLAANVATPLLGLFFWPLEALAGPVVSFDLAVSLAPVLTALSTYLVLARYLRHRSAAFLGGAVAGFSAGLTTELLQGHLQVTFLALVPLILALCHEALFRQPRRPLLLGGGLGLAVAAQALVGLEPLALLALPLALCGLAALALSPRPTAARLRRAAPIFAVAALVAGALLAYPLWFAFDGPRHLPQPIAVPHLGASLVSLLWPSHGLRAAFAGSLNGYLGIPLVVLAALGLATERHSRAVRLLAGSAGASLLLELGTRLRLSGGVTTALPLPSALLAHLPLLGEIWPLRFSLTSGLLLGLLLAVVLDRWATRWRARLPEGSGRLSRLLPAALLALAGCAALGGALLELPNPLPTLPGAEPAVYRSLERRLAPGTIVLSEPLVSNTATAPLLWQARDGFSFRLADGYGYVPTGKEASATGWLLEGGEAGRLFRAAERGRLGPPRPDEVEALRRQLASLSVGAVVLLADAPRGELRRLEGALLAAFGPAARLEPSPGGAVVLAG